MQPTVKKVSRQLEDALSFLLRRSVVNYRRGEVIYDEAHPSIGLSLIVQGRVKGAIAMEDGSQTVTGIYCSDESFGESSLLGCSSNREYATALDTASIMTWTAEEVEERIERRPPMGLALIQMLAERCVSLEERLHSLALDKTPQRVALIDN